MKDNKKITAAIAAVTHYMRMEEKAVLMQQTAMGGMPKVLSSRRRSAAGSWGRAAMVLGIGAAAWPFVYVTLTRLLRTLRGVEEVGPLLASKLLALGLLVFGVRTSTGARPLFSSKRE